MNEKDILEILTAFERELEEKLQESKGEVERIKYYEKFSIKGIDFNNMFITTEKDVDGNITYHLYCGDSSKEIISIDSQGEVNIKNPELKKYLGETDCDLEKMMEENEQDPKKLKGVSEKATPEEMKKALKGEKAEQSENEEEQDEETQAIEKDLEEQGENLEIDSYKKIKDNHLDERMPEVFGNGEENGIAFSNKLNRFVIISQQNGKYQMNENVEPARMTWKSIISIDEKGEKVERKVPYALMKVPNNPNKEIAVTIDDYGIVDIETVDVLPGQQRLARQVRVEGQGLEHEETRETRRDFQTQGQYYNRHIVEGVNKLEQIESEQGSIDYERTESDYIPDTKKTWGELMEETGESLPKLLERYDREMKKEGADSQDVVDTIEQDYENVGHEHQLGTN
ncbi:MAG: hypothetical protein IJE59_00320 [Clostridia bacterium]|nr:hypothetical protein [Clostridia bacterium]